MNLRFENSKKLKQFFEENKNNLAEITSVSPTPFSNPQKGGTCGYVASQNVIDYWRSVDKDIPTFNTAQESEIETLLKMGEPIVPTKNAIFNMHYFKDILEKTNHFTAKVYEFDAYDTCLMMVKKSLEANFPVIFAYDNAVTKNGIKPTFVEGSKAHYVTIVSLLKPKNDNMYCIVLSYGEYYTVDFKKMYSSCMNLKEYPFTVFTDQIPQLFIPQTSLENMRGKLVIAYPYLQQKKFDALDNTICEKLKEGVGNTITEKNLEKGSEYFSLNNFSLYINDKNYSCFNSMFSFWKSKFCGISNNKYEKNLSAYTK